MVSFVCDACQETVKKPKALRHMQQCGTSTMSCVDCSVMFDYHSINQHNSCISEAEKCQGKLFKGKKKGQVGGTTQSADDELEAQLLRPPYHCYLCNVRCSGVEPMRLHMQAKKHRNRAKRAAGVSVGTQESNSTPSATPAVQPDQPSSNGSKPSEPRSPGPVSTSKAKDSPFNPEKVIKKILKKAPSQKLSVKKLRKAFMKRALKAGKEEALAEKLFSKKVKKLANLSLDGDVCTLR